MDTRFLAVRSAGVQPSADALKSLRAGDRRVVCGVSHAVAQCERAIGIRLPLGANGSDVARLVMADGLKLTAVGLGAGALAAWAGSTVIAGLPYSVRPHDPATFAAVAGLLLIVAAAASYVPARRASRVNPIVSQRCE